MAKFLRDLPESGAQKSGKSTFASGPRKVPLEEQGAERGGPHSEVSVVVASHSLEHVL